MINDHCGVVKSHIAMHGIGCAQCEEKNFVDSQRPRFMHIVKLVDKLGKDHNKVYKSEMPKSRRLKTTRPWPKTTKKYIVLSCHL